MIWRSKYSQIGILFSLFLVALHFILFPEYAMSLPIASIGIMIILFFFFALNIYSNAWLNINNFKTRLFIHSLVYRTIAITGMYALTLLYDPASLPLEIGAADAWNYHISGEMVANTLRHNGNIFNTLSGFWKSENDYGYSIYIGFIYYIFGPSVYIAKFFNAILGSITVVRIYQIGQLIYSEEKARTAGILAMIFPSLLWFTSMLLKETVLIFILINAAYYVITITSFPHKSLKYAIYFLIFMIPLYYFRVFLFPLVILASIIHLIFLEIKGKKKKLIIQTISILLIFGIILVIFKLNMLSSFLSTFDQSSTVFTNELTNSAIQRGINYKMALVSPFVIIGSIITPFPSLLHFDDNQLAIYMHYQNEVIRNVMYFFMFLGIIHFWKLKRRESVFIITFAIGYISILALSGVSFQDRFQLLALPFLIILMPEGLGWHFPKKIRNWQIYLFIIALAVISWNLFKLSIRGLV
jgi:hypothetical protein